MSVNSDQVYEAICRWATTQGISVGTRQLKANKAGEFDGVSVTMNSEYHVEERTFYLVHALGSMVRWSQSPPEIQGLFEELRAAKQEKHTDPDRLERAIEQYRAFEVESSEYAVWLLAQLGADEVVPSFTNFMRADLEALTLFHRFGRAPVWREFFADWNAELSLRRTTAAPFTPKPIPAFHPKQIEMQEILQEQPSGVQN
jgi:hypothetical protein